MLRPEPAPERFGRRRRISRAVEQVDAEDIRLDLGPLDPRCILAEIFEQASRNARLVQANPMTQDVVRQFVRQHSGKLPVIRHPLHQIGGKLNVIPIRLAAKGAGDGYLKAGRTSLFRSDPDGLCASGSDNGDKCRAGLKPLLELGRPTANAIVAASVEENIVRERLVADAYELIILLQSGGVRCAAIGKRENRGSLSEAEGRPCRVPLPRTILGQTVKHDPRGDRAVGTQVGIRRGEPMPDREHPIVHFAQGRERPGCIGRRSAPRRGEAEDHGCGGDDGFDHCGMARRRCRPRQIVNIVAEHGPGAAHHRCCLCCAAQGLVKAGFIWQCGIECSARRGVEMSFRKLSVAAVAALSMTSAPLLAANPASSLSVARASASLENESELGGGFLIPLLALAAVVTGVVIAVDDEGDSA